MFLSPIILFTIGALLIFIAHPLTALPPYRRLHDFSPTTSKVRDISHFSSPPEAYPQTMDIGYNVTLTHMFSKNPILIAVSVTITDMP